MAGEQIHPVMLAMMAAAAKDRRALTKRPGLPVPRDNGKFFKGFSGNPRGRPPGRQSLRLAFHKFGLEGVAKLVALADDLTLSPGERAAVLSQCIQLSCSYRAIRSDASAQKKAEQLRREQELHEAMLAVFNRANGPQRQLPEPAAADPPWLR